jgi:chromosomal replication initiation ATPase DnaA
LGELQEMTIMSDPEVARLEAFERLELLRVRYENMKLAESRCDPEMEEVVLATCMAFEVSREDVMGRSRPRDVADARQVAMAFIRNRTKNSLKQIGDYFGNRDHGTVLHACRAVESKCCDLKFREKVANVQKLLATQ